MKMNIQELWDDYKRCVVYTFLGYQKETKERKRTGKMFKVILAEYFPKLMMNTEPQSQESQRTSSRINAK